MHRGCLSPFLITSYDLIAVWPYAAPAAVCSTTVMVVVAKPASLALVQQHHKQDIGQGESEIGRQAVEEAVRPAITCTVVTGHQLPI